MRPRYVAGLSFAGGIVAGVGALAVAACWEEIVASAKRRSPLKPGIYNLSQAQRTLEPQGWDLQLIGHLGTKTGYGLVRATPPENPRTAKRRQVSRNP